MRNFPVYIYYLDHIIEDISVNSVIKCFLFQKGVKDESKNNK